MKHTMGIRAVRLLNAARYLRQAERRSRKTFLRVGIASLTLATAGTGQLSAAVYQSFPTDDIWAYGSSESPATDPLLRTWGHAGNAIAPYEYPFWDTNPFWYGLIAYSFAKWDVASIPAGAYNVSAASVTVKIRGPQYPKAIADQFPIEARAVDNYFDEDTWSYNYHNPPHGPHTNPTVLFGTSDFSAYAPFPTIFSVPINLLAKEATLGRQTFHSHFNKWVNSGQKSIPLAFTTTLDVGTQDYGQGGYIYSFYSKDAGNGTYGPALAITYTPIAPISITDAKNVALGTRVYLTNLSVTAVSPDSSPAYLVVSNGVSFIRVNTDEDIKEVPIGHVVSIIGKAAVLGLERGIEGENILPTPTRTTTLATPASIGDAKSPELPLVKRQIKLTDVVVTAVYPWGPNVPTPTVFVSQPDRSSAIAVRVTYEADISDLVPGQVVDITGNSIIWEGAEFVINGSVTRKAVGTPLKPLRITNRATLTGPFGRQPGLPGGVGLSNIGQLIQTTGVVTGKKTSFPTYWFGDTTTKTYGAYWIDDGSKLSDGFLTDGSLPTRGIAVIHSNSLPYPTGQVTVTGVLRALEGPNGPVPAIVPLNLP